MMNEELIAQELIRIGNQQKEAGQELIKIGNELINIFKKPEVEKPEVKEVKLDLRTCLLKMLPCTQLEFRNKYNLTSKQGSRIVLKLVSEGKVVREKKSLGGGRFTYNLKKKY